MEVPSQSQDLTLGGTYCPTMRLVASRVPLRPGNGTSPAAPALEGSLAFRKPGRHLEAWTAAFHGLRLASEPNPCADPGHVELENEARDLAGRLIEAQEDERKRIAMELHDDLNQKLAVLAIELTRLEDQLEDASPQVHEQLRALEELASSLSEEVRRLSHSLHPATIQHVGLVAGLRSLCAAFGKEKDIAIEACLPELARVPSPAVALSLYRIAQGAFQNVRKHSQASEVRVSLTESQNTLRLSILDDGVGFDPERVGREAGLGLVSMKERCRLQRGTLRVRSSSGAGTEVEAWVPHGQAS
jgi:signal transduction histidine kinase